MVAALAARRLGVQDGLILACIQVSPLPLRLMVVQLARRPALWTRPIDPVMVCQANVDLSHLQLQFPSVHLPGSLDSQNAPIQFMVLHPRNRRMPPLEVLGAPLQTLNSRKGNSGFLVGDRARVGGRR